MAKEFMSSAKELAWKAYRDGIKNVNPDYVNEFTESQLSERFENWWSVNYGNIDSTKFIPEINIFIGNRRYIKAE
jgi:hypothetical protein